MPSLSRGGARTGLDDLAARTEGPLEAENGGHEPYVLRGSSPYGGVLTQQDSSGTVVFTPPSIGILSPWASLPHSTCRIMRLKMAFG